MLDAFEAWLAKVCERPLPIESFARIESFIREVADGAMRGYWTYRVFHRDSLPAFLVYGNNRHSIYPRNLHIAKALILVDFRKYPLVFEGENYRIAHYLHKRWEFEWPDLDIMYINGYLTDDLVLTKSAFDLARTAESGSVFVSYHRSQSSAFALLVSARLKTFGIDCFLDMSIQPGDDWHADIEQRIKSYSAFVLLLAPDTLRSESVCKEITWAFEAGMTVIPIYHARFKSVEDIDDNLLTPENRKRLGRINAIPVTDESAAGYNAAIVDLLNRFGVTP